MAGKIWSFLNFFFLNYSNDVIDLLLFLVILNTFEWCNWIFFLCNFYDLNYFLMFYILSFWKIRAIQSLKIFSLITTRDSLKFGHLWQKPNIRSWNKCQCKRDMESCCTLLRCIRREPWQFRIRPRRINQTLC